MTGARPDTWMPIYIGDYLKDTSRLTTEEHGAYLLLIMDYWVNGPLPNDDARLAAVARMTLPKWRKIAAGLRAFFTPAGNLLTHKRIDAELVRCAAISKERSSAGARGAAKRWQRDDNRMANAIAEPLANISQNDASHSHIEEKPDAIASEKRKAQANGTRIPDDWKPDEQDREFARSLSLDPDAVAPSFGDYWRAKPGAAGRKLDWPATWRNWCRRSAERAGSTQGGGRVPHRQGPNSLVAAARAVAAQIEGER